MTEPDIHIHLDEGVKECPEGFNDNAWKVQRSKERLCRENFQKTDKDLILAFVEHLLAQGVSGGRAYKLCWSLLGIRQMPWCGIAEADRKDIENLVAATNSASNWSPNTRSDSKKIVTGSHPSSLLLRYLSPGSRGSPRPLLGSWF